MREVSKNSRESKKIITTLYDFTPPHFTPSSNPLPQGEGEDSMCGALPQPPLTFLQGKKVSKKICAIAPLKSPTRRSQMTHPLAPSAREGEYLDALGVAQTHGLFASQKVSKKTFDLNDSRNSQESPSSMQLIGVLGGDIPLSSHISPSPKVKCVWRGLGGGVFEKDSCNSTQKSRRNASAKKWEKGRSSASADFLLEAEKRGSPPKSGVACEQSEAKTRQLLVRRGSGVGSAALLQEKTSEFSGKINSEFVNDSRESWGFKGATPPCAKSPSARMGLFASPSLWEGARGWVKFQNSKDSRESQESQKIFRFAQNDKILDSRESKNSLDYHKNSASLEFSHNDNMGNSHESAFADSHNNNTDSRESPHKNPQNNPTHKKTVFSGIQPTGDLHLGNYLGAIKTWVAHQELYENIFCIANSHAITTRQNPRYLRESTLNLACMLLACGIDPKKSALFIQSEVDYHPALAWILDCNIFMGDMSRMTQFKDKSAKNAKNINVGLFNYPALMAADILLYGADLVPVGADQKQHIELTRNVAIKFNRDFGECFKVPEPLIVRESARIMGLDNPNIKMSKSIKSPNHAIFLLDSPEIITRKIKRAVTDSEGVIAFDESRVGLYNLLCMYEVFSKKGRDEILREFSGKGYGALKSALSEAIISEIAPVREEYLRLQKNRDFVEGILKAGREKVEPIARETYKRAKKMVGLW